MADVTFPRNRDYKDLSLTMARNPVTNDVIAVTGPDAVKRAIKNLLLTNAGEVPFFPNFGTRLSRLLFEPADPVTTAMLETEIRGTIEAFEPRARIQSLTVTLSDDEHTYQVDVVFLLLNLPNPITLTVFLTRLR